MSYFRGRSIKGTPWFYLVTLAVQTPIGILAPLESDARAYLEMGFAFVAVGSDVVVLRKGCDALVKMFKS